MAEVLQEHVKETSFAAKAPLTLPEFVVCSTSWTQYLMPTAKTRFLHMLVNAQWCTDLIAICRQQKGCKALYLSGVLLRLQMGSCLSHAAKLFHPQLQCRHISCTCFGVLLALHGHIGCGKGVNCSHCTLLGSCMTMYCTYIMKSCTLGANLA